MPQSQSYLCVHVGYNASAAIMVDGVVVGAAQEERFTRQKNETGFPARAIDFCLKEAAIEGSDLTAAAYTTIYEHPWEVKAKVTPTYSLRDYHDYYGERYHARKMRGEDVLDYLRWLRDDDKFAHADPVFDYSFLTDEILDDPAAAVDSWTNERRRTLANYLGLAESQIEFIDHHSCHAHYSYFSGPTRGQDVAVVILDGWGDGRNQTVWLAKDDALSLIGESDQNDIGHVYKFATLHLGMRPDEHEFKVMGLAPYAKQQYVEKAAQKIKPINRTDGMRIQHDQRPADLYNYLREVWLDERFDNIAGAVQLYTEDLACGVLIAIHEQTGLRRFAIGGGISMNIKMNKVLSELDCVDDIMVAASSSDESLPIGGCYYLNQGAGSNVALESMYLGYNVNEELGSIDWDGIAKTHQVSHGVSAGDVAEKLAAGDIIARLNGRCEFGARALGNRSILADPSRRESVQKINEAIKNRDFWMPFAFSLLEDYADAYIENPKALAAKYMAIAFDTKPEGYDQIVAGTHPYDRTVRPQLVERTGSDGYYELIDAFRKVTGIPALLNTSFNLHGEPIVNNVKDAMHTFESSGLDHLLIGDTLISKAG
ncbi:MAG: hypothetical protein HOF70_20440 [Rhodospirillaceae bacterium]|nr:hypothetical protein [Rhodospirillaceae bacterium]MBT4115517.1 hypothetical protein [Rhodospirillaceae bacterium]MBT6288797.1 hypothetical protein [Rhodospirillaceae bacterium]